MVHVERTHDGIRCTTTIHPTDVDAAQWGSLSAPRDVHVERTSDGVRCVLRVCPHDEDYAEWAALRDG